MDNLDSTFLDCYITNYKKTVLERLNKMQLTNNTLVSQCDLLCLILEETPKIIEEQKEAKTYTIPSEVTTTNMTTIRSQDDEESGMPVINMANVDLSLSKDKGNKYNKDNEVIDFIHLIITEVINTAIQSSLKKNNNNDIIVSNTNTNNAAAEDDEEEDYFNLIDRRNKQIEENERKALEPKSTPNPKKSLASNHKIKVYLFQTMNYLEVDLKPEDTFLLIKIRIIQQLKSANKLTNKNTTHTDYEFKDFKKNKLLSSALNESENVINFNKNKVVLVEKLQFVVSPTASSGTPQSTNSETSNIEFDLSKIHLRVHIKFDKKNFYSTMIQVNGDMPLGIAFDKLKSKLIYKNKEFYYFVEHSEKTENEDMDNAFDNDLLIKYLPTFQLDLFMKTYSDIPDLFSAIQSQYFSNMPEINLDKKKGCESVDTNFLYNDINAGIYQEFAVTKINRHQTKQERLLGIDLYNIYNSLPKKSSSFFSLLQGKIKIQLRRLTEVIDCNQLGDKSFFIDVLEEGKTKRIIYEVKNSTIKNQIISKIKYLMKYNQRNVASDMKST